MGGSCTICQHPSQFKNPIIDHEINPQRPQSPNRQRQPNYQNSDITTGLVSNNHSKSTKQFFKFSENDYSNYLNLQKTLLLKKATMIKVHNFSELSYEGEMNEKNERNGKGILKWPCGTMFLGEWVNNKASGKGIIAFSNGEHYEGGFKENKYEGEGVYICSQGTRFEGTWICNFPDGSGCEVYPDGSRFEGTYRFGKKTGSGVIYFSDGSLFTGEFRDDEIDGFGVFVWPKGERTVYKGKWKNSKMNGLGGMFWFDSGKMYYGNYVNNKKNGLGVFFWGLKKKWAGFWKDGLRDGPGILMTPDNCEERGIWDKGKKVDVSVNLGNQQIFQEIVDFYQKAENDLELMG